MVRRLFCAHDVPWAMCIHRVRNCPDRDRISVDCRHISSSCGDLDRSDVSNLLYCIYPQEERLTWQTTLFLGDGYKTARCDGKSGKHVRFSFNSIKDTMS